MENMLCLEPDALAIFGNSHPLTRHPGKVLSKFNPDKKEFMEDHVNKFMLALRILNVEHKDIVYRLFPFTFEGKASTWYFLLTLGSIHNW